jgi:hypothetical protein
VATLHYEEYKDQGSLLDHLESEAENIQCIVAGAASDNSIQQSATVSPGQTQSPQLWDYADNVDTLKFLSNL